MKPTLDEAYSQLPLIFVDKWTSDTLSKEKLDKWFEEKKKYYEDEILRKEVLKKLTLDYWWDKIIQETTLAVNAINIAG